MCFGRESGEMTESSGVEDGDAILFQIAIPCDESEPFHPCLGDQHSVERITVDPREVSYGQCVRESDNQRLETIHVQGLLEVIGSIQFAQCLFDDDFPDRDNADEHGLLRIPDGLLRADGESGVT